MMASVFFYILAAFILYSALFVVAAHNLFRSAIGLIAVLLGVAGMYLLIDAQFLSAVQVMVYVGGIVVLIVFVVLLVADVTEKTFQKADRWRKLSAGFVVAIFFGITVWALDSHGFTSVSQKAQAASVKDYGRALLSTEKDGFILPFEVISLVLVAALIGAITIAGQAHAQPNGQKELP
jgi:NADH-quinone oxidoreductase subunit J